MKASGPPVTESLSPVAVLMGVPQFPPPVIGGLEKQAWLLSNRLVENGTRVVVLSGQIESGVAAPPPGQLDVTRLRWSPSRWVRAWRLPVSMLLAFRRMAPEVSLIHVHVISGFGLGLILLSRLWGRPILVKLANVGADGVPGLRALPLGRLRLWLLCKADAIVAMSTESIRELVAVGYDRHRILATPNGIHIPPMPVRAGRGRDHVRMAFVGRLHEEKGIPDLLAALLRLKPGMEWSLDLLGGGSLRDKLARRVRECGLEDRVRFLGHVEDVQQCLFDYDLLVLPSYREGNSNAILEAMVAGLPVVSTRVGGTPMLVGPEGTCVLHDPGDVPALAERLQHLLDNPGERRRLGACMRQRAEELFDIRHIARTYEAAYRLLAAGRADEIITLANPVIRWPEKT